MMKKVKFSFKTRLFAVLTAGVMLVSSAAILLSAQKNDVFAYAETDTQETSAISSVSLTLEDSIDMNFFATIPADAADDANLPWSSR